MNLDITCEPEDLDYMVGDAISNETNWLINGAEYQILEQKSL